jgi:hypothetical protein
MLFFWSVPFVSGDAVLFWRNGAQWCKTFMWHISVDKLWRYWTALDLTGRRNMAHTDGCADRWWFVHDFLGVGDLQGQTFTFSHGMAMYFVREDLPCKTNHVCRCISSNKIDHRLIWFVAMQHPWLQQTECTLHQETQRHWGQNGCKPQNRSKLRLLRFGLYSSACVCVGGGVVVAVCGFFYKKCRAKLDACHGNGQGWNWSNAGRNRAEM